AHAATVAADEDVGARHGHWRGIRIAPDVAAAAGPDGGKSLGRMQLRLVIEVLADARLSRGTVAVQDAGRRTARAGSRHGAGVAAIEDPAAQRGDVIALSRPGERLEGAMLPLDPEVTRGIARRGQIDVGGVELDLEHGVARDVRGGKVAAGVAVEALH